jgi:hypothetical protein
MHFLRQRKRMIGTLQPTGWRLWGFTPAARHTAFRGQVEPEATFILAEEPCAVTG